MKTLVRYLHMYGEFDGDTFIEHKWIKQNYRWVDKRTKEEKKSKRKVPPKWEKEIVKPKEIKETDDTKIWGKKTPRYICGEFIHIRRPDIKGPFMDIDTMEYRKRFYNEYNKI